jgi:hypothetical protein
MRPKITVTLTGIAYELLENKRGRMNRSAFLNGVILTLNKDEGIKK